MSDTERGHEEGEGERESKDSRALAELVKRSLGGPGDGAPDLLPGVQRKIRQRSRGKFYRDGWSTTNARASYVLVAIAMLLVLAVAYFALGPVSVMGR